jgi:hypothetical protein
MRFILGLLLKMLLIFIQIFYCVPLFIYIYYVYFIKEKNNTIQVNHKYRVSDDLSKRLKNDEVVQKFLNPTVMDFLKHLALMILLSVLIVKLIKLI